MFSSKRFVGILLLFCGFTLGLYAQFGIKAGLNMANEIRSFSNADIAKTFNSQNLTGYQLGLVFQALPKKQGLGMEIGVLLSQKGSVFQYDSAQTASSIIEGYREINYLELPLNARYHWRLGQLGLLVAAGVYGGYALSSSTMVETLNLLENHDYAQAISRLDYGYTAGMGVELFRTVQLGITYSKGLRNTAYSSTILPSAITINNSVLSVHLVYLFK